ncbi:MAG: pirin family protein [Rhodospirillales bacterium]|nr:pirin family protein [Rhodospirillales bacterium]
MIDIRPFARLGFFKNEWLEAHHHFSFADYFDPARMGHGALRVWNDDRIRPDTGFPPHGHRDMEIVTFIREGAITHEDGLGNKGRTQAGDVQVMSAGKGIIHAEYNREAEDTLLFQIWIETARRSAEPRWETREFPHAERQGKLLALASGRKGDADALLIHQDAAVLGASLTAGQSLAHGLGSRLAYLVSTRAPITVNGALAQPRDGVAVSGEEAIAIEAMGSTEIVLVDVAG